MLELMDAVLARIGFDETAGFDDTVLHVGQLSLQSSDIFFICLSS